MSKAEEIQSLPSSWQDHYHYYYHHCHHIGLTVYGLVDTLHIHIRYDEDDSLEDDLDRLFAEGNAAINERRLKRSTRKNASDGSKERSQPKQRTIDDIANTDEGNSESKEVDNNSDNVEV